MSKSPQVGDGVTYTVGSDRYPYTVVEILSPKKIAIQADFYRRTDNNGYGGTQEYAYTPNPDAAREYISLRTDDSWRKVGESLKSGRFIIGKRQAYQDPSF